MIRIRKNLNTIASSIIHTVNYRLRWLLTGQNRMVSSCQQLAELYSWLHPPSTLFAVMKYKATFIYICQIT
jgi:hypothetical protein